MVLLYFNHYFKYNYKWKSSYVFRTKLECNLDIRFQIMFMSRCKLKLHRRDPTADIGLRPEATWTCCAHSLCCDTAINWANSHSKILTRLDIGGLIFFSPQFSPQEQNILSRRMRLTKRNQREPKFPCLIKLIKLLLIRGHPSDCCSKRQKCASAQNVWLEPLGMFVALQKLLLITDSRTAVSNATFRLSLYQLPSTRSAHLPLPPL